MFLNKSKLEISVSLFIVLFIGIIYCQYIDFKKILDIYSMFIKIIRLGQGS